MDRGASRDRAGEGVDTKGGRGAGVDIDKAAPFIDPLRRGTAGHEHVAGGTDGNFLRRAAVENIHDTARRNGAARSHAAGGDVYAAAAGNGTAEQRRAVVEPHEVVDNGVDHYAVFGDTNDAAARNDEVLHQTAGEDLNGAAVVDGGAVHIAADGHVSFFVDDDFAGHAAREELDPAPCVDGGTRGDAAAEDVSGAAAVEGGIARHAAGGDI